MEQEKYGFSSAEEALIETNCKTLLNKLVEVLEKADVRKHICINGFGYSQVERDIVSLFMKELYTGEEVYQVAKRSVEVFVGECLTKEEPTPLDKIINSEIETVKLF